VSRSGAALSFSAFQSGRYAPDVGDLLAQSLAPDHPPASSSPITFILSLLPSSSRPAVVSLSAGTGTGTTSGSVESDEDAPPKRELALLLLRLLHTVALSTLSSTAMELSLLAEAPSRPAESSEARDSRTDRREEDDQTWRLERQPGNYKPRELISGGGRVLRPFTIMPSTTSMSDRERLRSEVFRSSHRLPSMTIE
jgi:immunoglobulin-binding protein 1